MNFSIGQLAKNAGVNIQTIRYYERIGLIPQPHRKKSGYRQYATSDVKKIQFIKKAQELGFTLKDIKDLLTLRVDPETTCEGVRVRAEKKIDDIENKLKELERMKNALLKLTASCSGKGPTGDCPILEAYRPWFMGFTILFLAGAIYYTYRKREVACEDGSCRIESGSKWNKISLWVITVMALLFMIFPYIDWSSGAIATGEGNMDTLTEITVPVKGMTCNSCNTVVEMAINKLYGINSVHADFQTKKAVVRYNKSKVELKEIIEAINKLGYQTGEITKRKHNEN